MNRFLMLLGVAAVAGAMYVAAAAGSQQSRSPSARQFAALKKQVARMSRTLKTVRKEADQADKYLRDCLLGANGGLLPVSQFGDPHATFGYQYFNGTTTVYRTALDIDASSTPQGYLQTVDPACASGNGLRHHGNLPNR